MVLRRRSLLRASTPLPTLRHKGGGGTKSLRAALDAGLRPDAGASLADRWIEQIGQRRIKRRRIRPRRLGAGRLGRIFFRMLRRIAELPGARAGGAFYPAPNN